MTVVLTGLQSGHAAAVGAVQHLGQGSDTRGSHVHLRSKQKSLGFFVCFFSSRVETSREAPLTFGKMWLNRSKKKKSVQEIESVALTFSIPLNPKKNES